MIGDMAEKVGHHPSILTEWGKVTVTCESFNKLFRRNRHNMCCTNRYNI